MLRSPPRLVLATALSMILVHGTDARAQAPGGMPPRPRESEPAPEMVVKVYRVDDLVLPSSNYPFRGTSLPGMAGERGSGRAMAGMGGMGMMGGGMMSMGGGQPGLESGMGGGGAPRERSAGHGMTIDGLMEAIQSLIAPEDWDRVGGHGDLTTLGGSLVVRQSTENQERILRFIEDLRQEVGAIRTVTVRAHWLLLSSPQLDNLLGDGDTAAGNEIDRRALRELAEGSASTERYRGQITCFNGQTVHIVSGRMRNVVQGGMPVVGGSGVGYQPLTSTPHLGAMLQVTPSLLPGGDAAVVDLQSTVTRWDQTAAEEVSRVTPGPAPRGDAREGEYADRADENTNKKPPRRRTPAQGGMEMGGMPTMQGMGGTMPMMQGMMSGMMPNAAPKKSDEAGPVPIDRVNIVAQQLATSLRVPLNRPVLVGGMTFPSVEGGPVSDEQLYLVLEVTAQEEPPPSGTPQRLPTRKGRSAVEK
ncbi:MAG TPA: hypothetical protein VJ783_04310 [Pirellulales bacterium]|nr:hypothetical protein [Pirellulales bacterium]